jgi:hypothetical protein
MKKGKSSIKSKTEVPSHLLLSRQPLVTKLQLAAERQTKRSVAKVGGEERTSRTHTHELTDFSQKIENLRDKEAYPYITID